MHIKKLSMIKRIKFLFFLKDKVSLFDIFEKRDFLFINFLWIFFINSLNNLFIKFKAKMLYFYNNAFFFRKQRSLYDLQIYNKLVFFNYSSFWAGPFLYSLGKRYFFQTYFVHKLSKYTMKFFNNLNFLQPFGFITFLNVMYDFVFF